MGEDTVTMLSKQLGMLFKQLTRIEDKLDKQSNEISSAVQRIAVLEAQMQQQVIINQQVQGLVKLKDKGIGAKEFIACCGVVISFGLSVWAAVFK